MALTRMPGRCHRQRFGRPAIAAFVGRTPFAGLPYRRDRDIITVRIFGNHLSTLTFHTFYIDIVANRDLHHIRNLPRRPTPPLFTGNINVFGCGLTPGHIGNAVAMTAA